MVFSKQDLLNAPIGTKFITEEKRGNTYIKIAKTETEIFPVFYSEFVNTLGEYVIRRYDY